MSFPVDSILEKLNAVLSRNGTALLRSPPGSGKTTRCAPYLLRHGDAWLRGRKILMLEPRRLAARMAADYMARQLGESTGKTVGYRIRLENRTSRSTRIEILTEGLLTQRLLADPELSDVGLVIFDEFHERSLAADTALALALDTRSALRPDLRILVMSATLDIAPLRARLPDAELLEAEGRLFPVETRWLPGFAATDRFRAEQVCSAILRALGEESGSILVFLPGEGEIRRVAELLRDANLPREVTVRPLYGALPRDEQDAAVAPPRTGERKVVLATSIAESSLTIEGIHVVIDSGWMRVPRFSAGSGMTRLETLRITRDRADQRRGRAGRLAPGVCYRLWDEATERNLAAASAPEIREADLAPLALQCAEWGTCDRLALPWIEPPPEANWSLALNLLSDLRAIDARRITPHGRELVRFPLHPRLAEMILRADTVGCAQAACMLAATVSEAPGEPALRKICDVEAIRARARDTHTPFGHRVAALAARWGRRFGPDRVLADAGALLAFAFPDRVAKRRDATGRYLMRNGRGVSIDPAEPVAQNEWLVCVELQDAPGDALIRLACAIREGDVLEIFRDRLAQETVTRWDRREERVRATRRETLGAITLREAPLNDADPGALATALAEGIRQKGVANLPWTKTAQELRDRVNFLHRALPDSPWPDWSDKALGDSLEAWFLPFASGITRWSSIGEVPLADALLARLRELGLTRAELDRLAPTHLPVPSGSQIAVHYEGEAPYMSVRIQETFGLTTTPRVAGGRVNVVMHLLSPAQRPVQVTADLESFWDQGYALVRKDLRGRYPKHYWPENPREAVATRRVRPR